MKNFWREVFSENNIASSKRVFGALSIVCCLFSMIYLTITEGGTIVVENILETFIIASISLLGLSSVTNIWKKKNKENKDKE